MYRLSLIISEIYNKYLPLAEKDGIILNLDFSDTTKEISDPERVKKYLDENLSSALKRSDKGEVTISVDKTAITVTDSGTTLSHSACALLSNRYIDVSSRVGFGTTVKIFLHPREIADKPETAKAPLEVKGVAVSAAVDKTTSEPTAQAGVAVAAKQGKQKLNLGARLRLKGKKTSSKTAKTNTKSTKSQTSTKAKSVKSKAKSAKTIKPQTRRQLAAAARKADREVKRIAKKAAKQSRELAKKAQKEKTKKPAKSQTKKTKKKLELS